MKEDDPKNWEFAKFLRELKIPPKFLESALDNFKMTRSDTIVVSEVPAYCERLFFVSLWLDYNGSARWSNLFNELFWCEIRSRHEMPRRPVVVRAKPGMKHLVIVQPPILIQEPGELIH